MNYLAVSVSVDSSLASPEEAINAVADFKSIVDATRTVMSGTYKKFAEKVIVRA
jgi:predicted DNA-binding protein